METLHSSVTHVRLPDVVAKRMKEMCEMNKIHVSEWIRNLIVNALGNTVYLHPSESIKQSVFREAKARNIPTIGLSKAKVCAVCGTKTEKWVYDMNQQVKCQGCAG